MISNDKYIVQTIRKMASKKMRTQKKVRFPTPILHRNCGLPISAMVKADVWEPDYSLKVIQLQLLSSALGFESPLPCRVW